MKVIEKPAFIERQSSSIHGREVVTSCSEFKK